ncbi:MAG: alpha/beta fold hydrolase [Promethearchaeota archaeon]|jgi:proline-specific peptidase
MGEAFAEVNDLKICYKVQGKGFPIILIHGLGSKKESFMAQIPELSKHFQVIVLDMRGAGKSSRPNYHYTMDMFADDIKGLMDYLKIDNAHLVGFSFGGMIAQTFVLKYPSYIAKLILINTSGLLKIPKDADLEAYIQTRIKGLELSKHDPIKAFWQSTQLGFPPEFREKMLNAKPKEKFYGLWSIEDLIEYYTTDPPRPQDFRNIISSLKSLNTSNRLHEINHNTLLLTASHDILVPKERMFEIHNIIPNSSIRVIENAGHESTKSEAIIVNKHIIEFLQK